jgi:hypothetical protein
MIYRGPEAFLRSSGSAPRPTPSPLSCQQLVSHCQSSCVSPVELTDGRGVGGGWRGAKSYDREYGWSYINHSILSGEEYLQTILSLLSLTRSDHERQGVPNVGYIADACPPWRKGLGPFRGYYKGSNKTREKGRGAIWESTGSYILLILLGEGAG